MKKIKMYITKKDYDMLIDNTIKTIMKEHNVSYDTACYVLQISDLYQQFDFIIKEE